MKIEIDMQTQVDFGPVKESVKKSMFKSVKHSINAIAKTARNSVRKRTGKMEEYDLQLFSPGGRRLMTVGQYFKIRNPNARIVVPDKRNVRDIHAKAAYRKTPSAKPGAPPFSYPTDRPGWDDYWLRNSIRGYPLQGDPNENYGFVASEPSKKAGISNPALPQVLEKGGFGFSGRGKLIGYTIRSYSESAAVPGREKGKKRKFKQQRVVYTPVYEHTMRSSKVAPHPFMEPALEKNIPKLPESWQQVLRLELR